MTMKKNKKMRKLIKSAKMGKPYALYTLGICYETGRYVEGDMLMAKELISVSASMGYTPAVEWIRDYYFDDDAGVQAEA